MSKAQIPTHDLYDKLGETISFDFQLMEAKQQYDSREPHRHSYYEIFLFLKGGGSHEIDFEELPILSKSIHFTSPGQVHIVNRAVDSKGFVIQFSREFFYLGLQNKDMLYELPFFNNPGVHPILEIPQAELVSFTDLFEKIQEEFLASNEDRDDMIRSYLNTLLISCKRSFLLQNKIESDTQDSESDLFRKFKTLIEQKFMHEHSVSEYAKLLFVTPGHLTEKVQKQVGRTASEVIHERIILEAKRLLYHSEHGVNEIANELNFEDPSYFSKFFKKHTDSSPGDYRSKIREKYQS